MEVWSVSTADGVVADTERLLGVLEQHHDRVVNCWQGFTDARWGHPSRNVEWSVHDTVRHVADGMEHGAAVCDGRNDIDPLQQFDPRSTPREWLESSEDESPTETIARFVAAAERFLEAVRARLATGDDARATTVYGDAHWTMNVVHLLWDSWIHERDVCFPLGIEQACSTDEERLIGLYGVFMAGVPSRLLSQQLTSTLGLSGLDHITLTVHCDGRQVTCYESPGAEADAVGDHGRAIDAISGRGPAVDDALPGAPAELGLLAAFMNS